jgi:signal transduction histidine kinase
VRRIVKELHTFARADTEPVAEVSLEDVADRALTLAAHELGPGARLARELRPAPPVIGSRSRLVQVVLNLLVNAAQALPQGRAPGANRIRITTGTTPEGRAFLEVQDSGRGIAPELLSHIFEPFFTTRMLRGGIGLGLSTSHNIVADHGGELTAESVLGEGSTFRLVLPAVPSPSGRGSG